MLKKDKEQLVAQLTERLRSTDTLFVADYRGLSVTDINELRTKLLEQGARFAVVKNTLTKLAAEAAGAKSLLELIDGPTAIAFLEPDADPAAAAKVLHDAARIGRVLVIRGGVLEGETITETDIRNLATLPPADVLRGQVVGALAGPLTTVVGLFNAPLRDLVNVLDARIKQLEEQEEAASPEPEAEAAEPEAEAAEPEAEAETAEPAAEAETEEEQPAEPEPETGGEQPETEEPAEETPTEEEQPEEQQPSEEEE
jgi:large subunit ribosomal protein L10